MSSAPHQPPFEKPELHEVNQAFNKKKDPWLCDPPCFFFSTLGSAVAHTRPFVGNVVICSHVKDDCDFWPLLRGSCRQRLLSCGFFNVLLNHLNGQLASCERIINISCQGIKTVLCPFLPSLWPLLEAPLGGLDTTQCCHLLVILRYCSEGSCVQSHGRTAGGRVQSAAAEKRGAAADVG